MYFALIFFNSFIGFVFNQQKCNYLVDRLDCSSKELKELPEVLNDGLKYIYLGNNQINELRPIYFNGSNQLEQIYLNNNRIGEIPKNQFENLEKLRILDLNRNQIRFIGENAFKGLYSIERIDLKHNQLVTFDQNIGLINNILKFTLDLSFNPLNCDCDLIWLVEKVKINQLNLAATCKEPDFLKDLPLNKPILPHLNSCSFESKNKRTNLIESNEKGNIKNVIIGDSVVLNCGFNFASALEKTPRHLKWYQNIQQINFKYNSKFQLYPNGSLKIKSLMPKDETIYTCKQDNFNFAYHLKVMGIIKYQKPPIFTILPDKLYELDLGTNLSLKCDAVAHPKAIITWFNKSLNRNLTTGNQLNFSNITSSIDGIYECIASNQFGYAVFEFTINVRGGDLVENKPSNRGLGSIVDELFTDQDIEEAIKEAKLSVEQAINQTIQYVLNQSDIEFPLIDYKDQQFYSSELTDQNEKSVSFIYPFNRTQSKSRERFSPSRLMKISRFPLNPNTIESAKSTEIFEKAIELLKRKSEMKHEFPTINFTYTDLLTTNQLNILNTLTGCLHGNRHHNLLKQQSCDSKQKSAKKCYRTIDGTCNNLKNPLNGAALTPFKRLLKPIYEDALHLPVGWLDNKLYNGFKLPNPRKVTLKLLSSLNSKEDGQNTHLLMGFGQFIDHDLSFSLPSVSFSTFDRINSVDCQTTCSKTPPCYSIPLEPNDIRKTRPHLLKNRNTTYSNCIEVIRSSSFCGSGLTSISLGVLMPREQINQLTSYLDLSQLYGSSVQLSLDLKDLNNDNGQMRTSLFKSKHYLPINEKKRWPNDCQQSPDKSDFECFLAGDIRSNEQLGLTVLHTLFLREHNRLASELKKLNSHWTGNKIYQEARNILIAKTQHIIYDHWLKHVLGSNEHEKLGRYEGYNESEDASISNVFSTAAFRFGHTLIQPFLTRLDPNYRPTTKYKSKLHLYEVFFSPHLIFEDDGLDSILRGLIYTPMKKPQPESVINHELTENLFELARHVSLDLASINIQRGRDHAIPGYNEWRKFCGLNYANTFDELYEIKNGTIRDQLKELYGHPSNIDLWVGCVLEDQLENAKVGPTFSCLIREQFKRTRSADRLWYERLYSNEKQIEIKRSSLAEIICSNTDIDLITKDVFKLPELQEGFIDCKDVQKSNLRSWRESENGIKKCN